MKHKKIIPFSIFVSLFFLSVLLIFVLRGSFFRYNDINSMIVEPKATDFLITGTWKIKSINSLDNEEDLKKFNENNKLYITKNKISFLDIAKENLKFKFRYVNFKNYLISKAIITDKIKINKENVVIVSVFDKLNFYQEFIVIDDSTIAMIRDKKYYVFEKEKDDVDIKINTNIEEKNFSTSRETTFLLGLKTKKNRNINYETILVRKNKEKISFNKIDGLFLNNNNKFFLVNSNTNNSIYLTEDYISLTNRKVLYRDNPIINFLSENYISFETRETENSKKNYEIHSVKNFKENSKLSISDISGTNGENLFFETVKKLGYSNEDITISDMYNFGVKRENGKWVFKSIFNNLDSLKKTSTELELDIIPKVDIFENKSNKIQKSIIKTKNPNYIDYFTSPNEDLAIILTPNELICYFINDGKLSTLPISSINFFEKKEVVSFKWENFEMANFIYNEFLKVKQLDINL